MEITEDDKEEEVRLSVQPQNEKKKQKQITRPVQLSKHENINAKRQQVYVIVLHNLRRCSGIKVCVYYEEPQMEKENEMKPKRKRKTERSVDFYDHTPGVS